MDLNLLLSIMSSITRQVTLLNFSFPMYKMLKIIVLLLKGNGEDLKKVKYVTHLV